MYPITIRGHTKYHLFLNLRFVVTIAKQFPSKKKLLIKSNEANGIFILLNVKINFKIQTIKMFYEKMIAFQIINNNREVKNPISVKLWTFQSNFIKLVSILKKNDLINKFFNKLCR